MHSQSIMPVLEELKGEEPTKVVSYVIVDDDESNKSSIHFRDSKIVEDSIYLKKWPTLAGWNKIFRKGETGRRKTIPSPRMTILIRGLLDLEISSSGSSRDIISHCGRTFKFLGLI